MLQRHSSNIATLTSQPALRALHRPVQAGIADISAYSGESLRRGHVAEMVKGRTL